MGSTPAGSSTLQDARDCPGSTTHIHITGHARRGQVRLAAGARSRGTVALELAPGRRGPLDDSDASRRRPRGAVRACFGLYLKELSRRLSAE